MKIRLGSGYKNALEHLKAIKKRRKLTYRERLRIEALLKKVEK